MNRPLPVPVITGLRSYAVPRPDVPTDLRLDGNEGCVPDAELLAALSEAGPEILRCYPDASPLRSAIARRFSLTPDRVLVTAGADEALDRVCRAFLEPGRSIVLPAPGFEMLAIYARLARAELREYEWLEAPFPIEALRACVDDSTAVVAIVSPNNPTGLAITEAELREVAAACPHAVLLVDTAYAEFAGFDPMSVALELSNAIVVRSLSKSWGIAGLRIGFASARGDWIDVLRAVGSPYSVAGPSALLAERWLERGADGVERFVTAVRIRRTRLTELFTDRGVRVWPSEANFVLARFADAAAVHDGLARHGISVRAFPGRPHVADCLRITCPATDQDMDRLERALEQVLEECGS